MAAPKLEGKVLITGASGFIGSRLLDVLLESGSDVVAIRRSASPQASRGRSVTADYANIAELEQLMAVEKPDYVLHVAGVTKGRSYEDFWQGNVMPTRNLLSALRSAHPELKRFVLVSSLTSYGPSSPSHPLQESDSPHPIEHYGKSKLEAEQAVEEEAANIPWTIVRPAAVYGPGDVDYFNLFKSAARGWNAYFGNRQREMSLIYVDDCVRGILEAAQHPACVGKGYFLSTGGPVTWEQLQDQILSTIQRDVRTVDLPELLVSLAAVGGEIASFIDKKPRLLNRQKAKMGAQNAWTCTSAAAKADFGFEGEVDMVEGVRLTHEWYVENQWYR